MRSVLLALNYQFTQNYTAKLTYTTCYIPLIINDLNKIYESKKLQNWQLHYVRRIKARNDLSRH